MNDGIRYEELLKGDDDHDHKEGMEPNNMSFQSQDSLYSSDVSEFSGFTEDFSLTEAKKKKLLSFESEDSDVESDARDSDGEDDDDEDDNDEDDDDADSLKFVATDDWDEASDMTFDSEKNEGSGKESPSSSTHSPGQLASLLVKHSTLGKDDDEDEGLMDDLILSFTALSENKKEEEEEENDDGIEIEANIQQENDKMRRGSTHSIVKVEVPDYILKSPDFLPKERVKTRKKKKKRQTAVPAIQDIPSPLQSPIIESNTFKIEPSSSIGRSPTMAQEGEGQAQMTNISAVAAASASATTATPPEFLSPGLKSMSTPTDMTTPFQNVAIQSELPSFLTPPPVSSYETPPPSDDEISLENEGTGIIPSGISRYNPLFYYDSKSLPLVDHSNRSKKEKSQAKKERKKQLAEERKRTQAFYSKLDNFFARGGIGEGESIEGDEANDNKEGETDVSYDEYIDDDDDSVGSFDSVEVTGMKKTNRKSKTSKSKKSKTSKKPSKKKTVAKKRGRRVDYELEDDMLEQDERPTINVDERIELILNNKELIFQQYDIPPPPPRPSPEVVKRRGRVNQRSISKSRTRGARSRSRSGSIDMVGRKPKRTMSSTVPNRPIDMVGRKPKRTMSSTASKKRLDQDPSGEDDAVVGDIRERVNRRSRSKSLPRGARSRSRSGSIDRVGRKPLRRKKSSVSEEAKTSTSSKRNLKANSKGLGESNGAEINSPKRAQSKTSERSTSHKSPSALERKRNGEDQALTADEAAKGTKKSSVTGGSSKPTTPNSTRRKKRGTSKEPRRESG